MSWVDNGKKDSRVEVSWVDNGKKDNSKSLESKWEFPVNFDADDQESEKREKMFQEATEGTSGELSQIKLNPAVWLGGRAVVWKQNSLYLGGSIPTWGVHDYMVPMAPLC